MKFGGVPVMVWGLLCVLMALVWLWVWPADRVSPGEGWRFIVLRWFHALTWLLLALGVFSAALRLAGGALVRPLAFAALLAYLVFLAVFVSSG